MRKNLLLAFNLFLAFGTFSQNKGIDFYSNSFDDAVELSKQTNKPLFVDFSTSWCGPCKKMENFVFTDSVVGAYYNQHFICLKYDAERGEGKTLKNRYEVNAYPTLLYLSPEQEVVSRHTGFRSSEDFIKMGSQVLNNESSYLSTMAAFENNNTGIVTPLVLDEFLNSIDLVQRDSVLIKYFDQIIESKWKDAQYFGLIESHSYSIFSPLSEFVLDNRQEFSEMYGKSRIDKFISGQMSIAFGSPSELYGRDYVDNLSLEEIKELIFIKFLKIDPVLAKKNKLDDEIGTIRRELTIHYKKSELWDRFVSSTLVYKNEFFHLDQEWYNYPNVWSLLAQNLIPRDLDKKHFIRISLENMKLRVNKDDYDEFARILCQITVENFIQGANNSKNSKKELSYALKVLSEQYGVSKVWAETFLSNIDEKDKKIESYKQELIKNAV